MSQVFKEGGSTANLMVGGTIFLFNRLIDPNTTPPKYRGNRNLGNVKTSPQNVQVEEKPHYSAQSGTKVEDDRLVIVTSQEFTVTFDEMTAENAWNYFRADSAPVDVAAATNGSAVAECHQLVVQETSWLDFYAPTAVVVKSFDNVTTYVVSTDGTNNDYVLVPSVRPGGYVGVKRTAGSTINDGDFVLINYTYKTRAHKSIKPYTADQVTGEATFFGVSKTRGEFIRPYKKVRITADGDFDVKPDDWSEFKIKVTILDNSSQYPDMPWGLFQYYGLGKKIYDGSSA